MCYGGCDCQRCNPPDEPQVTQSAWTTEKPTTAGWYWVRWPHEPHIGEEIREVTQPNGPDTDYLEAGDIPMDEYVEEYSPEWQPVEPAKE